MSERTSYGHGTFSWADLTTNDLEAAKAARMGGLDVGAGELVFALWGGTYDD